MGCHFISQSIALCGTASALVFLSYTSTYGSALVLMAIAVACCGFHNSGILVNPQDIAPSHAGSVFGKVTSLNSQLKFQQESLNFTFKVLARKINSGIAGSLWFRDENKSPIWQKLHHPPPFPSIHVIKKDNSCLLQLFWIAHRFLSKYDKFLVHE